MRDGRARRGGLPLPRPRTSSTGGGRRGEFLESATYGGQLYGTLRSEIERIFAEGRHAVLDIEIEGARQIRASFPNSLHVFVLPPSAEVLIERLKGRNTEPPEVAARADHPGGRGAGRGRRVRLRDREPGPGRRGGAGGRHSRRGGAPGVAGRTICPQFIERLRRDVVDRGRRRSEGQSRHDFDQEPQLTCASSHPQKSPSRPGNKYLGVLVAAKFARYLNEFPKDQLAQPGREAHHQGAAGAGRWRAQLQAGPPPPLRGLTVWAGRHVVLGVSGGIACYKSCILARRLTEAGARVDVGAHPGRRRVRRGPLTFEALTGRPVLTSLWEPGRALAHVRLRPGRRSHHRGAGHRAPDRPDGAGPGRRRAHRAAARPHRAAAPRTRDERRDVRRPEPPRPTSSACARAASRSSVPRSARWPEGPSERPGRMSEPETILAHAARLLRGGGKLAGPPGRGDRGTDPRVDRSGAGGHQPLQRQDGVPRGRGRRGSAARRWC